jgi:outer membrane protein insertion porin family
MTGKRFYLAAILVFVLVSASALQANAQRSIRDIKIQGLQRIEPETVVSYMGVRPGDPITQETLERAVKKLFRTGMFADVKVEPRDGILNVKVVENPIINRIAFEGNDEIKNEELEAEIRLRSRQIFTRTKVQADVNRIQQVYRRNGRFSVKIEPKVIRLDQNRVNLVFEIEEGPVTKVRSIRFVGNERYSDDALRGEISTKESRWYRFFSASDRYDPDRMAYDQELLRRFYLSNGYTDFQIVSAVAELSQDREQFYLTFTLEEGDRYKIDEIRINSELRNFNAEVLRPEITISPGDWYDVGEIQTSVNNMVDKLGDFQYAFVSVRPDVNRNRTENTIDIVFNISESPRVFVEKINIHGNVRTMDEVIRREMELLEGDPFIRSRLLASEQDIKDLDFFEKVDVSVRPGSTPDRSVIDVGVSEKSTGELSIGAGYSTSDGPLADIRIRERNLLGKGQDLLFAVTAAGERTEFDLSFTEPYFMDRNLSAGMDLFHVTRDLQDEASFDQERTGGALRLGYPLSEKWRQTLRYRYERNIIEDVSTDASLYIQEQVGTRRTSAVSQRLTYDNRDSKLFPTEGLWSWIDAEVAGLGGDAQYYSGKLGASYYHPFFEGNVVFNIMGEGGLIEGWGDENVAINERYFLGGNSLRGFESAGVGPRDTASDDSLGGNLFYRSTLEFSFPVGLPEELGVKGHLFNDAGSVWDVDNATGPDVLDESTIRASAGLGLSWRSPLGPIRLDYGMPYVKEDFDKEENFRFSFGTRF